jgi:hypothetical protein
MHPYLLELAIVLALIDTAVTYQRVQWELNPFVRWIWRRFGWAPACWIGVFGIQTLMAVVLACLTSPIPLALLAGAGINRSWMQLLSIELEERMLLQSGHSVPLPSPDAQSFKGFHGAT